MKNILQNLGKSRKTLENGKCQFKFYLFLAKLLLHYFSSNSVLYCIGTEDPYDLIAINSYQNFHSDCCGSAAAWGLNLYF